MLIKSALSLKPGGGKKKENWSESFQKAFRNGNPNKQNAYRKETVIIVFCKWFTLHESNAVTKSNNSLLLMIMSGD